jgi:hypothetical protein
MRSRLGVSSLLCGLALLCTHCGGSEDKDDDDTTISGIGKDSRRGGKPGARGDGGTSLAEPDAQGDASVGASGGPSDAGASDARAASETGASGEAGAGAPEAGTKPEAGVGTSFDAITSGVSGSKLLAAISDDDARKLCKFEEALAKATLPSSERSYCLVAWVETTETCEIDVSECMDSGEFQELRADWGCASATTDDYFSTGLKCNARVSAFESCSRENAEREHALYEKPTCASPKLFDLSLPSTPACRELLLECDISAAGR